METVNNVGAEPFIAFRTSDTGWSGGTYSCTATRNITQTLER